MSRITGGFRGGKAQERRNAGQVVVTVTAPDLVSILPVTGGDGGGTSVTLTGTSFVASGLAVTFGGAAATAVTFVNSTTITCVTPVGTAGARDIVVTTSNGNDTLAAGFTYTATSGGVPADTKVAINWSTTTTALDGGTGNALKDAGKSLPIARIEGDFTGGGGAHASEQVLSVIAASGLGFPQGMTNVLKVRRAPGVDCYGFVKLGVAADGSTLTNSWPALAVAGDKNFWRVYLKVMIADNQGNIGPGSPCNGVSGSSCSHHPIQFPHNSGNFEPTNFFSQNNGMMDWEAYTFANGDGQNTGERTKAVLGTYDGAPYGSQLPKFKVLRIEWMFRKDASNYSIHIRIYDATNESSGGTASLMWSEDGVGASEGAVKTEIGAGNQHTLAQENGLYNVGLTAIRSMAIGEEGGYYGYSVEQFFYWGGLMMRTADWCGPFNSGEQSF